VEVIIVVDELGVDPADVLASAFTRCLNGVKAVCPNDVYESR
jgi:hypothetical protein